MQREIKRNSVRQKNVIKSGSYRIILPDKSYLCQLSTINYQLMKYLYTALILAFLCQGGATAQEKKSGFFDKVKSTFSSEIKIGTYTFKDNGAVYTGEIKGRKPNGKGKTVFKNGDVYEGEYVKGKLNAKYFAEGVAEYQKRLAAFASFRIIELPEEKIEEKNASDAVVKKALDKEGKAILSNVRKGAAIVAMCIEGRQISSDELAQFLADRANSGAGDVAFVIGSSHGLSDEVKKAALKFSMGRITMPHQLARLVLTEQIYRACTINAGMKYHK